MHRMFAAVLLAASTLGFAALAPSSASAAMAPGPNAIPSADLVRSVDPAVTVVEQAGYRRHWDDDFDFHPRFKRRHVFDDDFHFRPRFKRRHYIDDDFDFYPRFKRRHVFHDDFDFHPKFRKEVIIKKVIIIKKPFHSRRGFHHW